MSASAGRSPTRSSVRCSLSKVGSDTGTELVPVWPHPRYAAACIEEGDQSEPAEIPLSEWRTAWLPGIERDKRRVAAFPTPDARGVVVTAERMLDDLQRYEDENY